MTCVTKIIENQANILQKTALQSMPEDGSIFDRILVDFWSIFRSQNRSKIDQQSIEERECNKMRPRWAKMAPSAIKKKRGTLALPIPAQNAPWGGKVGNPPNS